MARLATFKAVHCACRMLRCRPTKPVRFESAPGGGDWLRHGLRRAGSSSTWCRGALCASRFWSWNQRFSSFEETLKKLWSFYLWRVCSNARENVSWPPMEKVKIALLNMNFPRIAGLIQCKHGLNLFASKALDFKSEGEALLPREVWEIDSSLALCLRGIQIKQERRKISEHHSVKRQRYWT